MARDKGYMLGVINDNVELADEVGLLKVYQDIVVQRVKAATGVYLNTHYDTFEDDDLDVHFPLTTDIDTIIAQVKDAMGSSSGFDGVSRNELQMFRNYTSDVSVLNNSGKKSFYVVKGYMNGFLYMLSYVMTGEAKAGLFPGKDSYFDDREAGEFDIEYAKVSIKCFKNGRVDVSGMNDKQYGKLCAIIDALKKSR